MSDPRFDGSLDTPFARNSRLLLDLIDEQKEEVEPVRAVAVPTTEVPPRPTTKPVKSSSSRPVVPSSAPEDVSAELTYGTDLEILTSERSAASALDLVSEFMTKSNWTDDPEVILAGAVMIAGWKEPPILLCPEDGSKVRQIRARLIRDGIALPTDGKTTILRAAWLKPGLELSFGLDAMVAAGEIRRTWRGNYYIGEPRELYEPWYDDPPRAALEKLLGWMSGTTNDLVTQLAASGVPSSYYANVNQNLHYLKRSGLARQVRLLGCTIWTATG